MQTIINKFVSITWLTSDLYVNTVLHAIECVPDIASWSLSEFIFPTPCFRAQFQQCYFLYTKTNKGIIVNGQKASTNGFTPQVGLGKHWRLLGLIRDSQILMFMKYCPLSLFSIFFLFSSCITDSESITEDVIDQCFWTELRRTVKLGLGL